MHNYDGTSSKLYGFPTRLLRVWFIVDGAASIRYCEVVIAYVTGISTICVLYVPLNIWGVLNLVLDSLV